MNLYFGYFAASAAELVVDYSLRTGKSIMFPLLYCFVLIDSLAVSLNLRTEELRSAEFDWHSILSYSGRQAAGRGVHEDS